MTISSRRDLLKLGAAGLASLPWVVQQLADAQSVESGETTGVAETDIRRASISFRIGVPIWLNEARFTELLDLFDAHPGVTDEITLFTSETHPPLPLETLRERLPVAGARMESARARGYAAGINILSTLGHHEENLAHSLSGEFTPMTDPHGNICRGSFCPNDPRFREYIRQVYEALTAVKPDYLWIDDDVRLAGHMPVGECCFCDRCVALFSERSGTAFTRDSLRDALGGGTLDERMHLRRAFLQHNRDTLRDLFALIERTVHGLAPGLPLGFMTGDRFFEGYGFDAWAQVLAGPSGSPVRWRPGGGAYREDRLDDFPDKAHAMGRQVALLPASITCIQSEVESFPYQRLKKSVHATAMEAAAYIAAGCTGTAFNVMSQYDEPLAEYAPLVAGLRDARPFLDRLAAVLGRFPSVGVHSGWVKDTQIARNPDGPWFGSGGAPGHCNELWSTGLPAAYDAAHAQVTALSGDLPLALTDAELRAVLAGGVYLDGPAVTRLNAMGFGDLTGFEVEQVLHDDCIEELTPHALNGDFAGRRRNGRQSFWKGPAQLLRATGAAAESLSRCVDYTYAEVHPCCMGVFENALGGRVCVAGYYPWEQLQNLSKSSQLKHIFRWLSKDTMPACVESFHRANLWVRETEPGRYALVLLNAYLDPALDLALCIRTEKNAVETCSMRCETTEIQASGRDGDYARFVIPRIDPWELLLVTA